VDACSHLDTIVFRDVPEEIPGCEDCLKIDGWWVHLRRCTSCGHIACCDNSPHRHASVHATELGHPVIRSVEPYEQWFWCYLDEVPFVLDDVA
jgi:hypothetical protein